MRAYVIRPGDDLSSLAARNGFDPEEVWDDDHNADLRARRPDPEVLAPGDVIYLPEPAETACHLAAGTSNRYRAVVPKRRVDLVLTAGGSEPFANEPYEVRGLRRPISGRSDGQGAVTLELPAHLRQVELFLPEQETSVILRIGHFDPETTNSGVRTRLANLGYLAARDVAPPAFRSVAGETSAHELAAAVRAFQRDHGLDDTGELDDGTRASILQAHGR